MERPTAKKSDWKTKEMPLLRGHFKIKRHFTDEEITNLKFGNIPQEMEDKWFLYFEDGKLYAHRSWTGICIYIIAFNFETDVHKVTVNRNFKQYKNTVKNDREQLSRLLDWWVQPVNDYYHEWIDETVSSLSSQ